MTSREPEYLPIHTGAAEPLDEDRVGAPSSSSSKDDDIEEEPTPRLTRASTSRSAREREFQPIAAGDRAELHRIASDFAGTGGGSITRISTGTSGLERKDTLYGVDIGDPVLDPKNPEFDPYKWSRMYVAILPPLLFNLRYGNGMKISDDDRS